MKGVKVIHITGGHEDERRTIEEIYNGEFQARQLKVLTVKKDSVLGNHYHLFKSFFYIMGGSGEYIFENIETKEREVVKVFTRDLIIIDGKIAHAANLTTDTITLEGNTRKYKGKEDDIPYKLI